MYISLSCTVSGAQFSPRKYRNFAQQFWHLQKLSKNKDQIFLSYYF